MPFKEELTDVMRKWNATIQVVQSDDRADAWLEVEYKRFRTGEPVMESQTLGDFIDSELLDSL